MNITLYNNTSPKNKIGKSLTQVASLDGNLKESSSIINPTITIESSSPASFNYAYIDTFNRYYFVKDVTVIHDNIMRLSLAVDVLESFKTQILAQPVIIDKNAINYDLYLPDENLVTLVKTKTDILNFSSGLLESGEFILITAGG